jgi:hypothetical protein
MANVTSRFTIAGTDYDYEADQVEVRFVEDRDTYRRLDNVVETDVRRKLPVIRWRSVMVAANANAGGLSGAGLYEKIEREIAAGNSATFVPDISASAPNSATPSVGIVTRAGSHPNSYQIEQSAERLTRLFQVQGDRWLDPSVAADQDLIDDLHSLSDAI